MFLISICDIILSFKHGNSELLLLNIGILALSVYTLEFWPFFINTGILILSIHTLELWPYFLLELHWNYPLSFQTFEFWSYFVYHWNSDPILTNIGILILSFHWKQRISGVILPNTGILAYCLYTLVF